MFVAIHPSRGSFGWLGGLVLLALVFHAAPARAELVALTCPGIVQAQYAPGMTNTPQPVTTTVSGTFGPCVGLPLTLLSASFSGGGTGTLSCLSGSTQSTTLLSWSDGSVSQLSLTIALTVRPAGEVVVVYSGKVSAGRFLGADATMTLVLAHTQLDACFTAGGVTATVGPTDLLITGL